MRIDLYTKFLLTIISLCLVYLCLKDLKIPKVHAEEPLHVILVDSADRPIAPGFGPRYAGAVLRVEVENR
jgi:hypothetical protein